METYRDIQGWSASHVRYIMYQIICAFHYLRVFVNREFQHIDGIYHAS